uniref:Aprataxin-related protein n=1 Tax=Myoviridae sp. ctPoO4 TaxID=2827685 RepID=A0A8S5SMV3_9CAUD|nr:MAG TPA: aprataxin-related protein [Myoviridae sp. ctPoO4]
MLGDKRYLGFNSNSTYSLHWHILPAIVQPASV